MAKARKKGRTPVEPVLNDQYSGAVQSSGMVVDNTPKPRDERDLYNPSALLEDIRYSLDSVTLSTGLQSKVGFQSDTMKKTYVDAQQATADLSSGKKDVKVDRRVASMVRNKTVDESKKIVDTVSCKPRPTSNKGSGGSRKFVPWCGRKKR